MLIVVVLAVALVAVVVLVWLSAREREGAAEKGWAALRAGEAAPARIEELSRLPVPLTVQEEARREAERGGRARAVAIVRQATSLTLRDAADVVDGLRFGHTFPEAPASDAGVATPSA